MPTGKTILITGDKAIDKMLAELETKLRKKALTSALRQATKDIVLRDAIRLAPQSDVGKKSGHLKRYLKVRTAKGAKGKRLPRHQIGMAVVVLDKGGKGEWHKAWVARFLEWGTKYVDPVRFMRRALYENEREVKAVFVGHVAKQVKAIAAETRAKAAAEKG